MSVMAAKAAPTGAAATARVSQALMRQTSAMKACTAIATKMNIADHAAGTWM